MMEEKFKQTLEEANAQAVYASRRTAEAGAMYVEIIKAKNAEIDKLKDDVKARDVAIKDLQNKIDATLEEKLKDANT